ncbi:FAD/NAD(P)-binding domain-containing protein [Earliella scabrosa]|nr:FAD/NAD(P)-binding domain-containing protein [Earliella scabrosa]
MPVVIRKASLTLDFLVVGGGVGGLAVAYALSSAGHRVRVLEKHDYNAPSGGHRVPPNLSKILRQWVGEEELMKVAARNVRSPFRRVRTGEDVGLLEWKPTVMAETGGEFLLMHHDDLIQLLYKLATGAGARVDLNAAVATIHPGTDAQPNPKVVLTSGEILYANIIIGADGSQSMVREVVLGEPDRPKPGGLTVYVGVVKAEDILQDPELERTLHVDEWTMWMSPHRCFSGHFVRGKKEFFISIYSWRGLDGLEQGGEENWNELVPVDTALVDTDSPLLRRLVSLVPGGQLIRTQFMSRENENHTWLDSTGRVVLLGDAAHPSYPCGSHTGSMAVEDAVVFGSLFSHLSTTDQIPSFMSAYQELRQRRCALVKLADLANAHMVVLPDGPEADARDEDMSRKLDEWDEGMLKGQFEEIAEIFGYDAGDAAEEWWINWGRFDQGAREYPVWRMTEFDFSSIQAVRSE